jgi:hypothetical protein
MSDVRPAESGLAESLVRMHSGSEVLREEWFVDPSYLIGDEGKPVVFLHQFVEYRTKRGNVKRRSGFAVQEFDSEDAMVEWIEGREFTYGHPSDVPCLHWTPEGWEGAA